MVPILVPVLVDFLRKELMGIGHYSADLVSAVYLGPGFLERVDLILYLLFPSSRFPSQRSFLTFQIIHYLGMNALPIILASVAEVASVFVYRNRPCFRFVFWIVGSSTLNCSF